MTTHVDPITFLNSLRATRSFRPDPVPEAALHDILEVVRRSGSAMNLQPWHVIVIRDRAMLDRLGAIGGNCDHVANAPLALALIMDGKVEMFDTYDEGRLSERIMLAAEAHGLGSCIGWYGDPADCAAAKAALAVPAERTFRTIISIGYPAPRDAAAARPTPIKRKTLAEIVSQEQFGR